MNDGYDDECPICGDKVNTDELYLRDVPYLQRAIDVHIEPWTRVSCLDCQKGWIKRHTVICPDCHNPFVTINHRLARRCEKCRKIYTEKVRNVSGEKIRAKNKGLPSGIRQEEWIITLNHFKSCCVYCGKPYHIIEHFTPVMKGGGTEVRNCVPACAKCNQRKRTIDGRTEKEKLSNKLNVPIDHLYYIESYLDSR